MDPLWRDTNDSDQVAGMLHEGRCAARSGERASGLKVDPAAFAWWELFASVKGQAIWTSSAKEYRDGGFMEPILGFSGWYTARRQDEILAEQLAEAGGMTPSVREVMRGCAVALASPPSPEAGMIYFASRVGHDLDAGQAGGGRRPTTRRTPPPPRTPTSARSSPKPVAYDDARRAGRRGPRYRHRSFRSPRSTRPTRACAAC